MTLTKKETVREIGRRTRLRNKDVQLILETLVKVWTERLISGDRIELENMFVIEIQMIDRGDWTGVLNGKSAPRFIRRVVLRASKRLKSQLNPS